MSRPFRSASLAALVVAWLAFAGEAQACSCVPLELDSALEEMDGALVGSVESREEPPPAQDGTVSSGDLVTLVIDVERVFKGQIGPTVPVVTARDGASCGVSAQEGERVGLLLTIRARRWHASLCHQVEPDRLLAAGWTSYAPIGQGEDTRPVAWLASALVGFTLFAAALWIGLRRRRRPR